MAGIYRLVQLGAKAAQDGLDCEGEIKRNNSPWPK